MIAREELQYLETRAIVWQLIITVLKLGHQQRLPNRPFGPNLEMYFVYGAALILIWQHRPVRATTISRHLEIPRETTRRHLTQLTQLGLLQKGNGTFSAGRRSREHRGIEAGIKAIQEAAAKLL
jgi:hypothetical protein